MMLKQYKWISNRSNTYKCIYVLIASPLRNMTSIHLLGIRGVATSIPNNFTTMHTIRLIKIRRIGHYKPYSYYNVFNVHSLNCYVMHVMRLLVDVYDRNFLYDM